MTTSKKCVVCGGIKSVQQRYGVKCCMACASFFRRTILQNNGNIPESCTVKSCSGCTSCRMKKCKDKGMDERCIDLKANQPLKKCLICGRIKSMQRKYGVQSCSACSNFFRRTILKNNGKIPEPCTVENCSGCVSCRMKKCKDCGMDERRIRDQQQNKKVGRRIIIKKPNSNEKNRNEDRACKREKALSIKKLKTNKKLPLSGDSKSHKDDVEKQATRSNVKRKQEIMMYEETVILRPALFKINELLKNFSRDMDDALAELGKLMNKLMNQKQHKTQDISRLESKFEKTKQKISKLITKQDETFADFEKFKEEFQKQDNLKRSQILDLKLKLDKVKKIINAITVGADNRVIKIRNLQSELQKTKVIIDKIHSEIAVKQFEICEYPA